MNCKSQVAGCQLQKIEQPGFRGKSNYQSTRGNKLSKIDNLRGKLAMRLLAAPVTGAVILLLSGCSLREDQQYVQPYTEEVADWRQYLGVAVAVQFLLLAWVFWHTGRKGRMSRLLLGLVLVPLVWTKLGEWVYRLGKLVLDWGVFGKLIAIFLSFIGGIHGTSNVYSYLLGGVVFNDPDFLLYWAVPGVVASFAAALAFLVKGKKG